MSFKESFPSNFDPYKELFDKYNYGNICNEDIWVEMKRERDQNSNEEPYDYPEKCKTL